MEEDVVYSKLKRRSKTNRAIKAGSTNVLRPGVRLDSDAFQNLTSCAKMNLCGKILQEDP